ncbi:hypothetical protein PHLCEN_2v206 [Hermanssonia centrifuga]|nr:hypothetical protein PHLCEN_2v206 [Hermanssonia centrifuga]
MERNCEYARVDFSAGEKAAADVQACQQAVVAADKNLIDLRNSGVSEDIIQDAQAERHAAQEKLDTAYKALIDATGSLPARISTVDDDEAEESDDDGEEGEAESGDEDEGIEQLQSSTLIDDDEEDDSGDFKVEQH